MVTLAEAEAEAEHLAVLELLVLQVARVEMDFIPQVAAVQAATAMRHFLAAPEAAEAELLARVQMQARLLAEQIKERQEQAEQFQQAAEAAEAV